MNIEQIRDALLYCSVMNFVLLALWGLLCVLPHEWMYRAATRMFRCTEAQFDTVNLASIYFYKIGIVLFNLVPYLALRLMQ